MSHEAQKLEEFWHVKQVELQVTQDWLVLLRYVFEGQFDRQD